jgi:hypothetical protein
MTEPLSGGLTSAEQYVLKLLAEVKTRVGLLELLDINRRSQKSILSSDVHQAVLSLLRRGALRVDSDRRLKVTRKKYAA